MVCELMVVQEVCSEDLGVIAEEERTLADTCAVSKQGGSTVQNWSLQG